MPLPTSTAAYVLERRIFEAICANGQPSRYIAETPKAALRLRMRLHTFRKLESDPRFYNWELRLEGASILFRKVAAEGLLQTEAGDPIPLNPPQLDSFNEVSVEDLLKGFKLEGEE